PVAGVALSILILLVGSCLNYIIPNPQRVFVYVYSASVLPGMVLTMTNARAIWGSGRCCRCVKAMVQRYFVSIRRRGSPGNLAYY
ncbi:hypothetical protein MJM95_30950, partial [Salmonella enterica subsp. enterica serovar Anatum]|nr:hypothetical protein [Salmonella enterica subsp. enterica serovar Anatum]